MPSAAAVYAGRSLRTYRSHTAGGPGRQDGRGHGEQVRHDDHHDHCGDRPGAAPQDRPDRERDDGGDREHRRRGVTAATTTALAASTRPRRRAAVRVTRIRRRRYSAVMTIAPATARTMSPANVPTRACATVTPTPPPVQVLPGWAQCSIWRRAKASLRKAHLPMILELDGSAWIPDVAGTSLRSMLTAMIGEDR